MNKSKLKISCARLLVLLAVLFQQASSDLSPEPSLGGSLEPSPEPSLGGSLEPSPEPSLGGSPDSNITISRFWTTVQAPSVSKTVFKDPNIRLVFCVGLEGAGHHYLYGAIRDVIATRKDELTHISPQAISVTPYYVVDTMIEEPSYYASIVNQARKEMKSLAEKGKEVAPPGTVVTLGGMSSYPKLGGPNKVFQYLDLRMLAQMAEAEGVDLRLVYLQRPMKYMLLSTTVHRHFQENLGKSESAKKNFMKYVRIMFTEIAVMESFLAEIDPAFVVCHDFDRVGDADQASTIANFISPTEDFAGFILAALIEMAPPLNNVNETLLYDNVDEIVARLQVKLDTFEVALCGHVE